MADVSGFIQAIRSPATPLWVVALVALVAIVRGWPAIMAKVNEARRDQAGIADGLIGRFEKRVATLEQRCETLEGENIECHRNLAEAERRIAALEGYNDGQGQARQEAAGVVAIERLGKDRE